MGLRSRKHGQLCHEMVDCKGRRQSAIDEGGERTFLLPDRNPGAFWLLADLELVDRMVTAPRDGQSVCHDDVYKLSDERCSLTVHRRMGIWVVLVVCRPV